VRQKRERKTNEEAGGGKEKRREMRVIDRYKEI